MRLHENEFRIDADVVRQLLADQMPDLAGLDLRRFESSGTVNAVYRLGDDRLVRLPRAPDFTLGPEREARWMPVFARHLPVNVPAYHGLGAPTDYYPSHWSVLEWVDGAPADPSTLDSLDQAAVALGECVVALRDVPIDDAPAHGGYRGSGLGNMDSDFRHWVTKLPDDIDRSVVARVWDSCLSVGASIRPPSWLHTDLRGDNLIADDGHLVAVIDWEGCTVGDPSADHLAAWWLFNEDSRETFRTASGADKETWFRAMGWALHMCVAAIPYYTETNPEFARQARCALVEILSDFSDHA